MCFNSGGHFSFFADSLALILEFGVYHTRYDSISHLESVTRIMHHVLAWLSKKKKKPQNLARKLENHPPKKGQIINTQIPNSQRRKPLVSIDPSYTLKTRKPDPYFFTGTTLTNCRHPSFVA